MVTPAPQDDESLNKLINSTQVGHSPIIWGSATWTYLHLFSLRYPLVPSIEFQQDIRIFLHKFWQILGCGICSVEVLKYTKDNPIPLESRTSFVWYLFDMHNHVNTRRGVRKMTKQEFINIYIHHNQKRVQKEIDKYQRKIDYEKRKAQYKDWLSKYSIWIYIIFLVCAIICIISFYSQRS
jgi:ABC-type transport system substrate-binding protein